MSRCHNIYRRILSHPGNQGRSHVFLLSNRIVKVLPPVTLEWDQRDITVPVPVYGKFDRAFNYTTIQFYIGKLRPTLTIKCPLMNLVEACLRTPIHELYLAYRSKFRELPVAFLVAQFPFIGFYPHGPSINHRLPSMPCRTRLPRKAPRSPSRSEKPIYHVFIIAGWRQITTHNKIIQPRIFTSK
jgi:hypothetical protein